MYLIEFLEPSAIKLNLIEVERATATGEGEIRKQAMPRVVIVGAGFGGLNAAQGFG